MLLVPKLRVLFPRKLGSLSLMGGSKLGVVRSLEVARVGVYTRLVFLEHSTSRLFLKRFSVSF